MMSQGVENLYPKRQQRSLRANDWLREALQGKGAEEEKRQQQQAQMATRQSLNQKKTQAGIPDMFWKLKQTENWARGRTIWFENPVNFIM